MNELLLDIKDFKGLYKVFQVNLPKKKHLFYDCSLYLSYYDSSRASDEVDYLMKHCACLPTDPDLYIHIASIVNSPILSTTGTLSHA